jgi:hypothetical protein
MKAAQSKVRFEIYGGMARDVVDTLFESAVTSDLNSRFLYRLKRLVGIRRVRDARTLLAAQIEEAQIYHVPFVLKSQADEISIRFDTGDGTDDGIRIDRDAAFKVWQVCKGEFKDIPLDNTAKTFKPECS